MASQCKQPCLSPSTCMGEVAQTETCTSHCAMVDLDACPVQDMLPCPEQTFQVDPCPCQGTAACMIACPEVGLTCPPPAVSVPEDICCPEHTAACDPSSPPCVTACVCPAVTPCEPAQSKGGSNFPFQPTALPVEFCTPETAGMGVKTFPEQYATSSTDPCTETVGTGAKAFPLQHRILTVELCPTVTGGAGMETFPLHQAISPVEPCTPETAGTCVENISLQHPISTVEPCTLEVIETNMEEPCCGQGVIIGDPCPDQCSVICVGPCSSQSPICMEPCMSQSTAEPTGTFASQSTVELCTHADTSSAKGMVKGTGACPAPQTPFRLNTRTTAVVERCLSRCQNWLRGKK